MHRLTPRIRHYAWGSREALARLSGRPVPTDEPEAELWMGAHEDDPALVDLPDATVGLDAYVARSPEDVLGAADAERFGGRLPFLLKVLAPEQALSIQAHPNLEQVQSAPAGTYVDGWAKPEALYTLTEFEMFAGNRSFADIEALVARLDVPVLGELVASCAVAPHPVPAVLEALLTAPEALRARLVDDVIERCGRLRSDHPAFDAAWRVAQDYPGDIGSVVSLTMEHHVLPAGRYVYQAPGLLHAYVRGVGVEILSNSDNVVRAGLTPKEKNVRELLRILDADTPARIREHGDERVCSFPVEVEQFRLHRIAPGEDPAVVPGQGSARILLCLDGEATVHCDGAQVQLASAQSLFVTAREGEVRVHGSGAVFVAASGLSG